MQTQTSSAFTWPHRGSRSPASQEFKAAFAMRLGELMHARGLTITAMRAQIGGSDSQIRKWVAGQAAPSRKYLPKLTKLFNVTPQQLAGLAPSAAASGSAGASNGHAALPKKSHQRKVSLPAPLAEKIPLPQGAPFPSFELKTNADDARFATVTITGTYDIETAMAMLAMHRQAAATIKD